MQTKSQITFNDLDYKLKRKFIRECSESDEIRDCLHIIADEIYSKFNNLPNELTKFKIEYNQIVKYLTDGYLAFEIVYGNSDNILDLKELDPLSIIPSYINGKNVWIQHIESESEKRILFDSQIIYISYQSINSNISYVESLVRPLRILKAIESISIIHDDIIDRSDLEYVRYIFAKASRIPATFKKYSPESMHILIDTKFDKFIDKHLNNINKINAI